MSNELADSIFDPRGKNRFYELQLAPRTSLQALRDGKVLFFDNTKLDFCHYREIFTRLETVLNKHGIYRIKHVRQSVHGTMTEQIREQADHLVRKEVQAAVVALADMGTSVVTTIALSNWKKRDRHVIARLAAWRQSDRVCGALPGGATVYLPPRHLSGEYRQRYPPAG